MHPNFSIEQTCLIGLRHAAHVMRYTVGLVSPLSTQSGRCVIN